MHDVQLPLVLAGNSFYVAPGGSPNGDGSQSRPWDLATALSGSYPLPPGSTIWLHGGTYVGSFVSRLIGTSTAPIVVRQSEGERAVIDGNLSVKGEWAIYWGFEVMDSNLNQGKLNGIMVFGPHTKFINIIVHDHTGSGFGIWTEAPDSEVYGSIIYNNGMDKFSHGIYVQNQVDTKYIVDNIIFNQSGLGIHGYSLPGEYLHGFYIEGNVSFNNGTRSSKGSWPNILVGGETPADRMVVLNNYTYDQTGLGEYNVDLGYQTSHNKDVIVEGNYFVGGTTALHLQGWDQIALTGNTLYGATDLIELQLPPDIEVSTYQWNNNTYFTDANASPFRLSDKNIAFSGWQQATGLDQNSQYTERRPSGVKIVVRPNKYEQGRAHIIVYNWDKQDTVDVDVSKVLQPGAHYTVWNVQDYFGAPVASGVYDGALIRLPMIGIPPPRPIHDTGSEPPVTGAEFNVFVLRSTWSAGSPPLPTCTPPSRR